MSICFREIIGEEWGRQIEVGDDIDRFEDQIACATQWISSNNDLCRQTKFVCDISFEDKGKNTFVFGHTILHEQMKIFAEFAIDLWLSRMRDD